jgi:hypothetical protein
MGIKAVITAALVSFLLVGCTQDDSVSGLSGNAIIHQALTLSTHDVTGILYQIDCIDGTSITEYVDLNDGAMPTWLDSSAGEGHPFADLFTVLPATECTVTATPMQNETTPSEECAPVSETFTVIPNETIELVLISQCGGVAPGAGDFVTILNDPPVLTDLDMNPGKFICTGETLELTVSGYDPNGDQITVEWTVIDWPGAPAPGSYTLTPNTGTVVSFVADVEGPYMLNVTGTDTYGAATSLDFPVHVSDCDVCCKLDDGFQILPEFECPEGQEAPMEFCPDVCCKLDEGFEILPAGECPEANQTSMEMCIDVCCKLNDGSFEVLPAGECPGGNVAPEEFCADVCCKLVGYELIPADECPAGQVATMDHCEVCCDTKDGIIIVPMNECQEDLILPMEMCDSCDCPEGFDVTPDGLECIQVLTEATLQPTTTYQVCAGNQLEEYSVYGAIYPDGGAETSSYWGEPSQTVADGKLNNTGIWTCEPLIGNTQAPVGEWIGFSVCLDIEQSGDYLVGMGADNSIRFFLNNATSAIFQKLGDYNVNFRNWWVNPIHLNSGLNIVMLEGFNWGKWASFGAEISGPFPAGSLMTDGDMMAADYAGNIVFSTADQIGGNFTTGENSGLSCPAGYILNTCGAEPVCVRIERTNCI